MSEQEFQNQAHHIISMKRDTTKSDKPQRMWRCKTAEGVEVNIFEHSIQSRNTYRFFEEQYPEMNDMTQGKTLYWSQHPIQVLLVKEGDWWKVSAVHPRPEGAMPDSMFAPDPIKYRLAVSAQVQRLLGYDLAIWDTETTGLDSSGEIIQLAAISAKVNVPSLADQLFPPATQSKSDVLCDVLMKPQGAIKLTEIHGITPEMVESAPAFPDAYPEIKKALEGRIWVIYNADYDVMMLDAACRRHGLAPIKPLAVVCAMKLFSEWYGEWDEDRQQFKPQKLRFATNFFGLTNEAAHNALADVQTTLNVLRKMAEVVNVE